MAISAVDNALWDLKARLLASYASPIFWAVRTQSIPAYGSGGFTSYSDAELEAATGGLDRSRA